MFQFEINYLIGAVLSTYRCDGVQTYNKFFACGKICIYKQKRAGYVRTVVHSNTNN